MIGCLSTRNQIHCPRHFAPIGEELSVIFEFRNVVDALLYRIRITESGRPLRLKTTDQNHFKHPKVADSDARNNTTDGSNARIGTK